MHMAVDFEAKEFELFCNGGSSQKTLLEISTICKIPNPQLVKKFLQDHSFLLHTRAYFHRDRVPVLTYCVPSQLRNFFFDPGRCRHLYSMPRIIGKCWEAIKDVFEVKPTSNSTFFARGLREFFISSHHRDCQMSGASLMLSENLRNRSGDDNLLRFLGLLCKMPWDTCFDSKELRVCTLPIAQWVCETLVS
jgi:hypothetical protein